MDPLLKNEGIRASPLQWGGEPFFKVCARQDGTRACVRARRCSCVGGRACCVPNSSSVPGLRARPLPQNVTQQLVSGQLDAYLFDGALLKWFVLRDDPVSP